MIMSWHESLFLYIDHIDMAHIIPCFPIGGSTNIAGAFEKACEVVEDDGNRIGAPDIAVLITDGNPTVDESETMNKVSINAYIYISWANIW